MLNDVKNYFFGTSLDRILSSFDKVSSDLTVHIGLKKFEQDELTHLRNEIDEEIEVITAEVKRAGRVLDNIATIFA